MSPTGAGSGRVLRDHRADSPVGTARVHARIANSIAAALLRGRDLIDGRFPAWALLGALIPAAYLCFATGVILAFASLPRGFDYGRCVISRLASSRHNPAGYGFMMFGLIALATFLAPIPAWLGRNLVGCPFLRGRGRMTYRVGLLATALIAIERGFFPTHWSRLEAAHLALAGLAFGSLWLGLAILAGATEVPRVRWRWLYRPPWFLSACVLPIVVVAGLYLPLNVVPAPLARALPRLPRGLKLLRTETFWQWYLVTGLLFSTAALAYRARGSEGHGDGRATAGAWRIDTPRRMSPHRFVAVPASSGADDPVAEPGGRPSGPDPGR